MHVQCRTRPVISGVMIWRLLACVSLAVLTPAARAGVDPQPPIHWIVGGHASGVVAVDFAPDATTVASLGGGPVKLWSIADGSLLRTFSEGTFSRHDVCYTPDGQALVAAGTGGADMWRVSNGELLRHWGNMETGTCVAFSPDGSQIAVAGSASGFEEFTQIFRLSDGQPVHEFEVQSRKYVFSMVFTPDGQTLITGGGDVFSDTGGVLRYWRLSDGMETRTIVVDETSFQTLAVSPDGVLLTHAAGNGDIQLRNAADGSLLDTLSGHTQVVNELAFSPDGSQLASSSNDASIRIWDVSSRSLLRTLEGHEFGVRSVAWSPDGTQLVSGGSRSVGQDSDKTVRLWDAELGSQLRDFTQIHGRVDDVDVAADAGLAAYAVAFEGVHVRRQSDGALVRMIPVSGYTIEVAISDDGRVLGTGGSEGVPRLWDVETGQLLHEFPDLGATVWGLDVSPDGQLLAAHQFNSAIMLWSVDTGELVRTIGNSGFSALRFSPDSEFLAANTGSGTSLFRVSDGAFLRFFQHEFGMLDVAISPDGELLASVSSARTARIYRVADASLVHELSGHGDWVQAVAFSRDGRTLATSSFNHDRSLRLWDVETGDPLAIYTRDMGAGVSAIEPLAAGRFALARLDSAMIAMSNPFEFVPGDLNCDGALDGADIEPFLLAIGDPDGYAGSFPQCDAGLADLNLDGSVDGADIDPFFECLAGGNCP